MGTRGLTLAFALLLCAGSAQAEAPIKVGSKRFTESYILGEIIARVAQGEHRPGLGNTAILYAALRSGAIDVYPEYTGTIAAEILQTQAHPAAAELNRLLEPLGLAVSVPLGFGNSYALGMRRTQAERLGIRTISALRAHPDLRFGLSHEFLGRRDGWPGILSAYGLPQRPRGLDHGLAYQALADGEVDVIDLYTTDAQIARMDIALLQDDRGFFPAYEAVLLHRLDARARFPQAFGRLERLQGRIDADTMRRLNARAQIDRVPYARVAQEYLGGEAGSGPRSLLRAIFADDFWRLLGEHVGLVFGSLAAAIAVGVPLGLAAAKSRWLEQPVLVATGLVQTIPSLALLAFLIPVTGSIGLWPALIALFLYALLPIARNTHVGLAQVPRGLTEAAVALGMRRLETLRAIELPLALPTVLAGVKTAAIVSVGTATIAAFVGAGGFGERIAQGLALNDSTILLAGALPAAALALGVHALFEVAERSLARAPR